MTGRLEYKKPTYYCNKVLIGPWVEDRDNAEFVPQNYKHKTTYSDSFEPKPFSRINPAILWDQKLNSEESNFISQIGQHEHPNFFENFSSTYDLSYNHFPKCFPSYIPRVLRFRMEEYEPAEDYIPSFGNITKFGLLPYKREAWACEKQDPRRTYSTVYRDEFIPYSSGDYKGKRWGIPRENSSIMDKNNIQSMHLKLRGQAMCNVPPAENLVLVPREPRCNPITWECPPDHNFDRKCT